jgi:hypothetical protein
MTVVDIFLFPLPCLTPFSASVVALSNAKVTESAVVLFPGGPSVTTVAALPHTACRMGILFLPPNIGLSPEVLGSGCYMQFYLAVSKVWVNMQLHGRGGRWAYFGINRGGIWQAPPGASYKIMNALKMAAQMVFCRVEAASAATSYHATPS